MEFIKIAPRIIQVINELGKARTALEDRIKKRDGIGYPESLQEQYEIELAYTIADMEDGNPYKIKGKEFKKKPGSNITKTVATGAIASTEAARKYRIVEGEITALKIKISALEKELSGLQTIYGKQNEV